MREIKFRSWDIDRKKMCDVHNLAFHADYIYKAITIEQELGLYSTFVSIEKFVLMQYTGLTDKNGVEIFEGDLVRFTNGIDEIDNEVGKVVWEQSECNFVAQYKTTNRATQKENGTTKTIYLISNEIYRKDVEYEVIGNIYENSDLLEV